jgi:hypothetical protein
MVVSIHGDNTVSKYKNESKHFSRRKKMTKLNDLEEAIKGASILFWPGNTWNALMK